MVSTVGSVQTPKTNRSPSNQQPKSLWQKALPVIALQVVAILFVEVVLALSGLGEEEIFRFDQQLGFCHIPNKHVTWRSEGYSQSWFNADGMREPGLTIAKPANTYRVALLGDSMTEGLQVPIEKTFGQIVQSRLSPLDGKNVQVLNFATSGYSTVQEYLQMKRQVFKYSPDLVIYCYNSRDMFENWAAPDQVITNVRPSAIHLPHGYLYFDQSPVIRWWGTPRARFLIATSWFREHSRIYGLLTALELDWSQHNPWYRAFVFALAHPKKTRNDLKEAFAPNNIGKTANNIVSALIPSTANGPAFQIKFFEESPAKPAAAPPVIANAAVKTSPAPAAVVPASAVTVGVKPGSSAVLAASEKHVFNSVASNETLSNHPEIPVAATARGKVIPGESSEISALPDAPKDMYGQLIVRTLNSLFKEIKDSCALNHAKAAVIAMPSRAQLCPHAGLERTFANMDYNQELAIVSGVCRQNQIGYHDCEADAEQLPMSCRDALYYTVHLTPQGQTFIADCVQPFIKSELEHSRN